MFFHYIKKDMMICDFQLIYDTDCLIHFDFYAYGLLKEPKVLGVKEQYTMLASGMLEIATNAYYKIEKSMEDYCGNLEILNNITSKMIKDLYKLINITEKVESIMEKGIYDIDDFHLLFESITDVMAYRRIIDKSSDILMEQLNYKDIQKLNLPSYLIILQKTMDTLNSSTLDEDLDVFIKEYAFLNSFDIQPTQYENKEFLRKITNAKQSQEVIRISPMKIDYNEDACSNLLEQVIYRLSWYSELRHIYQLRALRNFRLFFINHKIDLFSTSAKEVFSL